MYIRRKREQRTQSEATTTLSRASAPTRPATQASGAPLEHGTREFMEARFGHDFSQVRVHTDSAAASSAKLANAQAYTVGNNVVFGSGLYNPRSPSGRQLLAHELAHVVQQNNPRGATAQTPDYESEANTASRGIEKGVRPSVTLAAPAALQRQATPGSGPQGDLTESASPFMAGAIGSVTLDGFETGKADLSADNRTKLARTADTIMKLFKQHPASTIRVIGYTDAVGQEKDNQVLGQSRADSVQAALLEMGMPGVAVHTESRGAGELAVKSKKSEPRNRRVEVLFEPSRLLHGALSKGLTLTPGVAQPTPPPAGVGKGVGPGIGDLCITNPSLCSGKGGPPTVPENALKPIPDNTPFELMDVQGVNEPYTSHGRRPEEGGDLRATWARLYWKYRRNVGLSKELAAKAANWELSSTAAKDLGRDSPNPADRLDRDMQRGYPGATKVGPGNITIWKF
jgi:outer membrane protein OmpA-like peptidoglycan-associated protein